MPAQSTIVSPQHLVEIAKASVLAFNQKNWDAVKASVAPDVVYDEVATNRRVQGVDQLISLWQGWATAFPDAKATFDREYVSGDTVVLEVRWRGTHQGPLQSSSGPITATDNRIDVRACMVVEVAGEKAAAQRHYFDMLTLLQQIGVAG